MFFTSRYPNNKFTTHISFFFFHSGTWDKKLVFYSFPFYSYVHSCFLPLRSSPYFFIHLFSVIHVLGFVSCLGAALVIIIIPIVFCCCCCSPLCSSSYNRFTVTTTLATNDHAPGGVLFSRAHPSFRYHLPSSSSTK